LKAKNSQPTETEKTKAALIEENALLREKLEKFEAISSLKEDRLNTVATQFKVGFWEWDDTSNRNTYYSEEMANIFGVSLAEMYERFKCVEDFYPVIHPEDLEYYQWHTGPDDPDEVGQMPEVFDYRIIRPDGQIRHLRELEYETIIKDGNYIHSYGVLQDITEHQKSSLALKLSEERYSSLFAQLPVGVQEEDYSAVKKIVDKLFRQGVTDLKGFFQSNPEVLRRAIDGTKITSVNEALLKIHQADSEETFLAAEADLDDWWDDEWIEFYSSEIDALAGPDSYYEVERIDTNMHDDYIETRTVTSLVRGCEDSWSRVITTCEDITERKKYQTIILEAKEEAEKASLAKSEFLSCMSHELRTPLNSILGFSQLAELDPGISAEQKSYVRKINHAGKHLLILIEEILDLSRIETGDVELSIEAVSLGDVISDSVSWVAALAERRGVKFEFDATMLADVLVEADAIKLKQVFLNLLTNAVKYNQQDGNVSIVCSQHDMGLVRIGIKDTGPGISNDRIAELFQPFNRLGAEFSEIEGTGIGLVITQKLITLMNGRLEVESVLGEGSVFWIELPSVKQVSGQNSNLYIVPSKNTRASALVTSTNPKILVAEDNPVNQELIATQMKALGYDADYAVNGSEALKLWEASEYDLLITDIRMPVMDGFELIRQVRSKEAGGSEAKPIIAITANAMDREKQRCFEAGVNDVMSKPVGLEDLRISLGRWSPKIEAAVYSGQKSVVNQSLPRAVGEVVNLAVLGQSVGTKPEIHKKLLKSYIRSLPQALDDVQIAFTWRNHELLSEYVHKLKSSSRSVGATSMSEVCRVIELGCMENRWQDIELQMTQLKQSAMQVEAFVDVYSDGVMLDTTEILPVEFGDDDTDIDLSILVVDDDYITHKVTALLLDDMGFRNVHSALSGPRGLEILSEQDDAIDIVVCDLNMPDMDGVEFTRRLAERNFEGSLIFISGEDIRILKTVEKLAIEHGLHVLGAIEKPVTQAKLSEMLLLLDQINSEKSLTFINTHTINVEDLSDAIRSGKLETYFQPKVDVRTRKVTGLEALVRWNHPGEGLLHPNVFVPLAEENDLICDLTMLVCDQALQHAVTLKALGFDLNIGINISVDALKNLAWPDEIAGQIESAGLHPSSITFEITESRLMENISVALDILSRLSLKRFNLSIDDFGTGYSSMEQLQRIPFSELKIDRAFVRGASDDPSARAILESNQLLARKLDMSIVAEGVETQEDWDLVTELGCDQVQGYFIARPMHIDALCEWLGRWQMPD
jgi:EAL domain-containing protein (putative c-di-GMP-specific phosphodiesterase class I)/signal transduction histidine kinase/DNA-binding response OmpR family regulator/HPt (histidine-containing phosphotransfer) domain-containing protein